MDSRSGHLITPYSENKSFAWENPIKKHVLHFDIQRSKDQRKHEKFFVPLDLCEVVFGCLFPPYCFVVNSKDLKP